MKRFFFIFLIEAICSINAFAAAKDQIAIVVMGQASTRDEAISSALRSAIEQSYGAFISSKTSINNDLLVSDEVVSISSGNIKKYTILSELNNGNNYSVTINAVVSLSKLSNFMTKHGESCSFDGNVLDNNIKLMRFRAKNTEKCLKNLLEQLYLFSHYAFSFDVNKVENPIYSEKNGCYYFPVIISCVSNDVSAKIKKLLTSTLKEISLSNETIQEYENFVGVTKVPKYKVILPGKHENIVKSIESTLRACLYGGVIIKANGTKCEKKLNMWKMTATVEYDEFWKKEYVRYPHGYGRPGDPWEYVYKHLKNGDKDLPNCVFQYGDADPLDINRWEMLDKKNGRLIYKIKIFLPLPQNELSLFEGVSVERRK